ncbi:hypothetical protein D3C86_1895990 [compost metagenome]
MVYEHLSRGLRAEEGGRDSLLDQIVQGEAETDSEQRRGIRRAEVFDASGEQRNWKREGAGNQLQLLGAMGPGNECGRDVNVRSAHGDNHEPAIGTGLCAGHCRERE